MALAGRVVRDRSSLEMHCSVAARTAPLLLSLTIFLLTVPAVLSADSTNSNPAALPGSGGTTAAHRLDANLGAWNQGVLLALGAAAVIFLVAFFVAVARGDLPRLESDLGGFGGGLGGWQLSPALAFLGGAIVLSLCVTLLALRWMSPPPLSQERTSPAPGFAATAAGGPVNPPGPGAMTPSH